MAHKKCPGCGERSMRLVFSETGLQQYECPICAECLSIDGKRPPKVEGKFLDCNAVNRITKAVG